MAFTKEALLKVKAATLVKLVKRAKLEKKAISPQLIQTILAFGPQLLSGLSRVGKFFGSRGISRLGSRLPFNLGRAAQTVGRGVGHGLRGLGARRSGSWLLNRIKSPATMAGRGQALRFGQGGMGALSNLAFGSMFLPPEWLGMGYEDEYPQMTAAQPSKTLLPPNPYLAQMSQGYGQGQ